MTIVKAAQLQGGMRVSKASEAPARVRRDTETVPSRFTGTCSKGIHFGDKCYDYLGEWYVYTS